jgi:hypothetical protein
VSALRRYGLGMRGSLDDAGRSAAFTNRSGPSEPALRGIVVVWQAISNKGQLMAVLKRRPRSSARKMRSHEAWITFDGDARSYECKVADISADGAKLVSDADVIVGSHLKLSTSPHATVSKRCEVMWRRGRQIGVKFVK